MSEPDPREGFLPPWPDWQTTDDEVLADRLREDTAGVESGTPEARAAIAVVIGVGNYEALLGADRNPVIMDAAVARLKELEGGDRSKYWG